MPELTIRCDCWAREHQVTFSYFEDEDFELGVYIEPHLVTYKNIFRRWWVAVKYILALERSPYGEWDSIMMSGTSLDDLVTFLQGYQDRNAEPPCTCGDKLREVSESWHCPLHGICGRVA